MTEAHKVSSGRPIRQLEYADLNSDGLDYSGPCRGVWNIVHYGTLMPEGHQIYVCPASCLRGVVLTTAELGPEAMGRLSTITVGEDNILRGDMEEQILEGTRHIIESLNSRPRMIMIFTSCIHHFLAVNYRRVYAKLREDYPDIDFIDCYMDPIMRKKNPPMASLRRQMMRPLKVEAGCPGEVSYIGNCFPMREHCDLTAYLKKNGITIHDITEMRDYDEFRGMARSSINFTFHEVAARAGRDLELRLGQKWIPMRETYDYDAIDEDMRNAAAALGLPVITEAEIRGERSLTEDVAGRLCSKLGGVPVSIDDTAVDRPLELALYLHRHGFCIESVVIEKNSEDEAVFSALRAHAPELKVYSAVSWRMRRTQRGHEGCLLAIGQRSAWLSDTDHFVNITENAGMYGYSGIRHLMMLMEDAFDEPKPMRELVGIKGWNCGKGGR